MIAISPKINIIAKRKASIASHERERNQLPQSDTAKDVHAAWTCRKSRKRCGQDYERLAFPRMARSKREGRDTSRLRSPINADRKTGQEERTDKKDSESKIGQEKPFITNESQENPARKPDKKTRQEGAKNAANPIILPRSKILHRNIGTYRTKRPRKLQAHLHRPVDSRREAPHDRAGQPDKPESKVYKHARISVDEAHQIR